MNYAIKLIKEVSWGLLLGVICSVSSLGEESEAADNSRSINREGWRVGLDLGLGSIEYDRFGISRSEETFYGSFYAGYAVTSQLRLGLETNGWLLEAGNLNYSTHSSGEGISQVILLTIHFYPLKNSNLYMKMGWGQSSYWNDTPRIRETGSGAWTLGLGNDFRINDRYGWSPHISVSHGDTHGMSYDAVTVAISFFWDRN